jgi:serine/threonine-protein kinase
MSDRWRRIEELYHAAQTRPASERSAFLREACAGDETLRIEVESLLAQGASRASFLETPAVASGGIPPPPVESLIGRRFGPYDVKALIGVGGMGRVYRARDHVLGRDVAIKVLPAALASDAGRLARFQREARLLAALNDPHIAAIHGVETVDGVPALVLELVDGPTLADRLERGPLPLREALTIATQIAAALEAAHECGIVHRDLKPANIKMTSGGSVKVLDFGLAKAATDDGSAFDLSRSPTVTVKATAEGVVLGTAAYMSPEQATGRPVDKRTDLWAFGAVLYEMLTGRQTFTGDDITQIVTQLLTTEPNWRALPADTPEAIRRLLRRCLERDRTRRLDSAAAARLEIDDALTSTGAEPRATWLAKSRRAVAVVAIGALTAVALLEAIFIRGNRPSASQAPVTPTRVAIVPPPDQPLLVSPFGRTIAISPDGRYVAYISGTQSQSGVLMLRALDRVDSQPMAGVTNATWPFFSPDSQWIGYLDGEELKKVAVSGGAPVTVARNLGVAGGLSWTDDDTIIITSTDPTTGLLQVPASGGEPKVLTRPNVAEREGDHWFSSALPGSRGVLFTIVAGAEDTQVAVFDSKTEQRKTLVRGASFAQYVGPPADSAQAGHLLYIAGGVLNAVRFDLARLEVQGDAMPVLNSLFVTSIRAADYAVSRTGTLVYVPREADSRTTAGRSPVWVDRAGRETLVNAPPRAYTAPRLSPDGTHVAFEVNDQENDVWIWDFGRETLARLTLGRSSEGSPVWIRDGSRIIYASNRASAAYNLFSQPADGSGPAERLTTWDDNQAPTSVTSDGTILGVARHVGTGRDIVRFRPASSATTVAEPLVQTPFEETDAMISPDDRYFAYRSNESGRFEVYVRPYPRANDARWQISTHGGNSPVWARNGRELFYLDDSGTLMAVPVQTSGTAFIAGKPAMLFDAGRYDTTESSYDVSPDGRRFLMMKKNSAETKTTATGTLVVVLNWMEELKVPRAPR